MPFVVSLLRCHLELCDKLADSQAIFTNWQRRIDLTAQEGQAANSGLIAAFSWVIGREQWGALELLEQNYADSIQGQRLLLYLMASARNKQGRSAEAHEFATQAYQTVGRGDSVNVAEAQQRNRCADLIAELGRHDWAEREWSFVIEAMPATEIQSLIARNAMALYRYHDRGDHQAAADVLGESIEAINKDRPATDHFLAALFRIANFSWLAATKPNRTTSPSAGTWIGRSHSLPITPMY